MLIVISIIFVIAAFFGSRLFDKVTKGEQTYKPFAFAHGILAGLGFVLLIVYISFTEDTAPALPFAIFFSAAGFGSVMFVEDILEKPIPVWLAYAHAILATAGILILIFLAFF